MRKSVSWVCDLAWSGGYTSFIMLNSFQLLIKYKMLKNQPFLLSSSQMLYLSFLYMYILKCQQLLLYEHDKFRAQCSLA